MIYNDIYNYILYIIIYNRSQSSRVMCCTPCLGHLGPNEYLLCDLHKISAKAPRRTRTRCPHLATLG